MTSLQVVDQFSWIGLRRRCGLSAASPSSAFVKIIHVFLLLACSGAAPKIADNDVNKRPHSHFCQCQDTASCAQFTWRFSEGPEFASLNQSSSHEVEFCEQMKRIWLKRLAVWTQPVTPSRPDSPGVLVPLPRISKCTCHLIPSNFYGSQAGPCASSPASERTFPPHLTVGSTFHLQIKLQIY